jgi:hypothetical protein
MFEVHKVRLCGNGLLSILRPFEVITENSTEMIVSAHFDLRSALFIMPFAYELALHQQTGPVSGVHLLLR